MPDNPVINNLAIATDEVEVSTGVFVHFQRWKPVDGRPEGTEGIPGTAANGLWVDSRESVAVATTVAVTASVTSKTLKALNAARRKLSVFNTSSETLYVLCAAGASAALFTVAIPPSGYWEMPFNYTGIVTGVWGGAGTPSGAAMVTEY